jgi:protein-S-isoprenylcysteine O-methyltransferase Ste14
MDKARTGDPPAKQEIFMSIFIIILSLLLWGIVHSALASQFVKEMVRGMVGEGVARMYRLGYNAFSVLSFVPILYLAVILPDRPLYTAPAPWNILMFGGQLLAVLLLLITLFQTDALHFIGLRQLFVDREQGALVTRGFYRLVRHPLYTFGLMFLWLTPNMTENTFTLYIGATIYFVVGAYFEERRLLREFGADYQEYKRRTPMLVPGLFFGKK